MGRRLEQDEEDSSPCQPLTGDSNPGSITPETLSKRKSEIEALLMEGLNSGPATEMTSENWAALRRRVDAMLARQTT